MDAVAQCRMVRKNFFPSRDNTMNKIIGNKYPAKVLRDKATGKPVLIEHTKDGAAMRRLARASAKRIVDMMKNAVQGAA